MKLFHQSNLRQALDHAAEGAQALHMHSIVFANSPRCFVRDVRKGRRIAHLFDQDLDRLRKTSRRLGVKVIIVEYEGGRHQHVDLCGKPLLAALEAIGIPWPGRMAKPISDAPGEDHVIPCPKQGLCRFDAGYASGLSLCEVCGFKYFDHPSDLDHPYLRVMCDGSLTKL